ncbi:MAG: selenide, water dikinase SelD [Pseudomonadota bacterium]
MLLGGGHAHVEVVRAFGMQPPHRTRVTLVAREAQSPYSGMLPAYLAGAYEHAELHIDLYRLCQQAGVRFVHAEVQALDLDRRRLHIDGRPAIGYDLLSLNTGAVPAALVSGPEVVPVKPIGQFLPRWEALRAGLVPGDRLALVGLGAGAVELAMALRTQLPADVELVLVGGRLLPGWPQRACRWARRELAAAAIEVLEGQRVDRFEQGTLQGDEGFALSVRAVLDVTGVQAPDWIRNSGLATDEQGFVRVDRKLQSLSHRSVFAAGDIAALEGQPRPKSGVYAVRAGAALHRNLRAAAGSARLRPYRAQGSALALLSNSRGTTLACRGRFTVSARWLTVLKARIDHRFIERYNGPLKTPAERAAEYLERHPAEVDRELMRCQGCGGKVTAAALSAGLDSLPPIQHPALLAGAGDDAAVLSIGNRRLIASTDSMSAFISDPYRFARFVTHHSANDVIAMGGPLTAALSTVQLAPGGDVLQARDLEQLLGGINDTLASYGAALAGGHSFAGAELTLGLTVLGELDAEPLFKSGLEPGDRLIVTRPLGSGVLLAAAMRAIAGTQELVPLFEAMAQSNEPALEVLRQHHTHALTDVTGFGLLGHLAEMLDASALGARIEVDCVPLYAGAAELARAGIGSSLLKGNRSSVERFAGPVAGWQRDLLCDPQTAGGLLAAVPQEHAAACVAALNAAGFDSAAVCGRVTAAAEGWHLG